MLVKVNKFIFLDDFVVFDIEVDEDVPIILGHPFLNTYDIVIEVKQGRLTLRMVDEQVVH